MGLNTGALTGFTVVACLVLAVFQVCRLAPMPISQEHPPKSLSFCPATTCPPLRLLPLLLVFFFAHASPLQVTGNSGRVVLFNEEPKGPHPIPVMDGHGFGTNSAFIGMGDGQGTRSAPSRPDPLLALAVLVSWSPMSNRPCR